ncbi:MAG: hypothetical protein WC365_09545, partial [Candidatus Babeliales bacterium]
MSTVRKHVSDHKHVASDIIGNVASSLNKNASSGYSGSGMLDVRCAATSLTNFEMIAQTYGYLGEVWQPNLNPRTDEVEQFENGDSIIRFSDSTTGNYLNLFLVISNENNDNPILALNHGMLIKKDLSVGGFLGCNQGALWLGHGLD